MKISRKLFVLPAMALLVVLFTPRRAYALFDDTLFWIKQLALEARAVAQLQSQVTNLEYQLKIAKANTVALTNKNTYRSAAMTRWERWSTSNMYGETAGFGQVVSGAAPMSARQVYQQATVGLRGMSYLSASTPGQSRRLADAASVEMSDSTAINCLAAIGNYQKDELANREAIARLTAAQSASTGADSQTQQLNLLNLATIAERNEIAAQGQVNACRAQQQVVSDTFQRNDRAEALNNAGDVAAAKAQRPSMLNPNATYESLTGYKVP